MQFYIPAAGFCKIKKAVDHFFQFLSAFGDHIHIISDHIAQVFLFDKFNISDHRSQRCFKIMGYICDQVHPELVASRYLFQTLSLDLQRLLQALLSLFCHFLDLLLYVKILLLIKQIQLLPSEPQEHRVQKDKLHKHSKDHHIACSVIVVPSSTVPYAAGYKIPHIPQSTDQGRRTSLADFSLRSSSGLFPCFIRILFRHPHTAAHLLQQSADDNTSSCSRKEVSQYPEEYSIPGCMPCTVYDDHVKHPQSEYQEERSKYIFRLRPVKFHKPL